MNKGHIIGTYIQIKMISSILIMTDIFKILKKTISKILITSRELCDRETEFEEISEVVQSLPNNNTLIGSQKPRSNTPYPQKDQDLTALSSWHPLSLLNTIIRSFQKFSAIDSKKHSLN